MTRYDYWKLQESFFETEEDVAVQDKIKDERDEALIDAYESREAGYYRGGM